MNGTHALTASSSFFLRAAKVAAPAFCFLSGTILLVLVLSPGDGFWPLHAELMLQGNRLYSDLGVNQQPLFFLLSMLSYKYAPGTILGQRIMPLILLALDVYIIYKSAAFVSKSRLELLVLQLAVFFTASGSSYFRFDDYHLLTHFGVFTSIYLSMLYIADREPLARYTLLQVLIATLVFLTRINDAFAIVASVGLIVLLKHGFSRVLIPLAGVGIILSSSILFLTLLALGESPTTWLQSTFIEASSAKGGASMLSYPYKLVLNSVAYIKSPIVAPLSVLFVPIAVGSAAAWRLRQNETWSNRIVAATCVYSIVILQRGYSLDALHTLPPSLFLGLIVGTVVCATLMAARRLQGLDQSHIWWALSFYPLFSFLFGSLSTAGEIGPMIFPLAAALLVFPIVVLSQLRPAFVKGVRLGFMLLCTLLAADGSWTRFRIPFSWWSYSVSPLGPEYKLRSDSRRGVHFITDDLAALIDPVCARLEQNSSLMSTPFPFANYYCGVPTWRGYVQTWYDLSTDAKINRLLNDLRRRPPDYVFYQQQEGALRHHEEVFNQGRPLPYRKLESYIRERVFRGEWRVVYESRLYPDSHWLLLRTSAHASPSTLMTPRVSEVQIRREPYRAPARWLPPVPNSATLLRSPRVSSP